ncbi:hypothetical protein [Mongoliitalea daihaiensis]|uniref:hypothetical protein n=1 Tax=Mongoliitalea daihaiensis TaxID=2782006 RepID=UPI001F43CF8B|nr:hypothetical protein [Mongoliitalea daihaiensis]UJP66503.1 hypothetical protein IPZ59_07865 [Mongoliitalea daihaiensis]
MRKISLFIILALFIFSSEAQSQNLVEKDEYKLFNTSYDKENFILRKVNDTLHVYIQEEKKISFFWADISSKRGFPSFENDIEKFLQLLASLKLPTATESYSIRYSPNSNQISFSPLEEIRFRKMGEEIFPTKTQKVRFSYAEGMMDVVIYLGEIDELLVLKEAGISDMVKEIWEDKDWMSQYNQRRLNKELHLLSDGRKELITYSNLDSKSRFINLDFSVGASILGNQLPITSDWMLVFENGKRRKWTGFKSTWELSFKTYNFFQPDSEGGFDYLRESFINAGYSMNFNYDWRTTIKYGRKINNSREDSILASYNNRLSFDYHLNSSFIFTIDFFFKNFREPWIPSVGINYAF